MNLYFVRHGESEANVLRVISNRGLVHGLTDKGRNQAQALAERMAGLNLSHIYTSPLLRARQTAAIIAEQCGLVSVTTDALLEYDCGSLEGRSDADAWQQHDAFAASWLIDQRWDNKPDGGESFNDIRARFIPFVTGLTTTHPNPDSQIALVAHGGLYRLMLPLLLSNVDQEFVETHGIANTAVIHVVAEEGTLRCIDWCGVPCA